MQQLSTIHEKPTASEISFRTVRCAEATPQPHGGPSAAKGSASCPMGANHGLTLELRHPKFQLINALGGSITAKFLAKLDEISRFAFIHLLIHSCMNVVKFHMCCTHLQTSAWPGPGPGPGQPAMLGLCLGQAGPGGSSC